MIISRTPFSFALCEGSSDGPSVTAAKNVLAFCVNKFVTLSAIKSFRGETVLRYSKTETVDAISQIQHPIFKAALERYDIRGYELSSQFDIPTSAGLPTSCSFSVSLVNLLYGLNAKPVSDYKLAKEAFSIQHESKMPIRELDCFPSAFGGLRLYHLFPNGFVKIEPLIIPREKRLDFSSRIMFFHCPSSGSSLFAKKKDVPNCPLSMVTAIKESIETGSIRNTIGLLNLQRDNLFCSKKPFLQSPFAGSLSSGGICVFPLVDDGKVILTLSDSFSSNDILSFFQSVGYTRLSMSFDTHGAELFFVD